jgi:hypothetical protein
MTPQPNSSSGGSSLPPRHRPNKGSLAKDTMEDHLWAFDELDAPESSVPPVESTRPMVPPPRDGEKARLRPFEGGIQPKVTLENREGIRVNIGKARSSFQSEKMSAAQAKAESTFDALDDWEEPEALVVPDPVPPEPVKPVPEAPAANELATTLALEGETAAIAEPEVKSGESKISVAVPPPSVGDDKSDDRDEFSVQVRKDLTPISLRPRLGLSKSERVGLIALVAVLVLGVGLIFFQAIGGLPSSSEFESKVDFPVTGKRVSLVSAETFWRVPITRGGRRDTVRRGTELLPVITLSTQGGPAALRVFFRDSEGKVVGDAVTRATGSGGTLEISATAGFEEAWMFDSYKTSDGKPWTVEVLEAASVNSPGPEFKRLLEMNISSERR